jgi:hypothetical protein
MRKANHEHRTPIRLPNGVVKRCSALQSITPPPKAPLSLKTAWILATLRFPIKHGMMPVRLQHHAV